MSKDVVLILYGGLDSSTLLYKLLNEGNSVTALSFNYGQKASIEIERAAEICKMNGVPHFVFDIQNIVDLLSSSLTDKDNDNVEEPRNTVVPSRNTILLELATAFAISNEKEEVYYGAIKADVGDYPDTTPEFLKQINEKDLEKVKIDLFDNIDFYLIKNKYVIINKKTHPEIHFVIHNPKLRISIETFLNKSIKKG